MSSETNQNNWWDGQINIDNLVDSKNNQLQWDVVKLWGVTVDESNTKTTPEPVKSNNTSNITNNTQTQATAPKVTVQVKQWNKLGSWWIIIWCIGFFVVFVGIIFGALFFATNNPQTLQSIWMSTSTVKTLLYIFAGLFFGIIILWLLWLAIYNAYRAATIKEWSKAKNIFGALVGFFFMLVFWWLAIVSFSRIGKIESNDNLWSQAMIMPYIEVKPSPNNTDTLNGKRAINTANTKIIWPVNIYYQVNMTLFQQNMLQRIWQNSNINYLKLDCGNGQTLDTRTTALDGNSMWSEPCLYINKWQYTITLEYNYTNIDWTTSNIIDTVWVIPVSSEIVILWDKQQKNTLNDRKTEIIVWNSPIKVNINAQKIFTDLWLTDVNINWDLDGDGNVDKKNRAEFTQYYLNPKLYSIYYTLPWFDYTFVSKIRVNAWDVPPCEISTEKVADTTRRFMLNIDDNQTDISSYRFEIINIDKDDILRSVNSDKKLIEYTFEPWEEYKVRWFFTTTENKNGFCESNNISISNNWYSIFTTFSAKLPTETEYRKIEISWQNNTEDSVIEVSDLPTLLTFKIEKTIPNVSNPNYQVKINNTILNPSDQWIYTIRLEDSNVKKLIIKWMDNNQKEFSKTFDIVVKKKNVVANIKVDKSVWFDPLTVKFDASISKLNDLEDEIIYFTRDFWDWEKLNNISQWKITHTYKFDTLKESWEYYPIVTVKTKKWFTDTYAMATPIVVKRQLRTAKIIINSHPWQLAKVWDVVDLSVQTDGDVRWIDWSFGNGKNMSCENRSCTDTNIMYEDPGFYDIVVNVRYNDAPTNTQVVKIKVE